MAGRNLPAFPILSSCQSSPTLPPQPGARETILRDADLACVPRQRFVCRLDRPVEFDGSFENCRRYALKLFGLVTFLDYARHVRIVDFSIEPVQGPPRLASCESVIAHEKPPSHSDLYRFA